MRRASNESGGPPAGEPPLTSERWPSVSEHGARDVAVALAAMGFRTIPVKPRGKEPDAGKAWQHQDASAESIPKRFSSTTGPGARNVGIRLDGMLDGRLVVDVDLDDERALAVADEYLPPTSCEFGREGAPRSHRLYIIDAPSRFAAWRMPRDLCPVEVDESGVERAKPVNLVEHRHGHGKQTVAPGSIHRSGELIRWDSLGAPTEVAAADLFKAVQTLAEAVIAQERIVQGKQAPRLADAHAPEQKPRQRQQTGAEQLADVCGMAKQYSEEGADHFRRRLRAHGWTAAEGHDQEYWVRPGKQVAEGHSASLKQIDGRWVFRCYSASAAPFDPDRTLGIFDGLALLDHNGDRGAAADALLAGGFGEGHELIRLRHAGAASSHATATRSSASADPDESAWDRVRREADALRQRRPFPIESIPEPLQTYAVQLARSTSTPVEMAGLGLLVAAAAAIGSSTVLEIKPGWQVPSILFGAVAVRSGSMKSPVLRSCLRWAWQRDREARAAHAEATTRWKIATKRHVLDLKEWSRGGGAGEPPEEPEAPILERFCVNDATVEAIAHALAANPRGALFAFDELGSLYGGLDRYRAKGGGSKGGGDLDFWTRLYEGDPYSVDRKAGGPLFLPHLGGSIVGGVQPRRLAQLLGEEHLAGGFESRWVYVAPPPWLDLLSEERIGKGTQEATDQVFRNLYSLPLPGEHEGVPEPAVVWLDDPAFKRVCDFINENAHARFSEHDDDHRAALAKAKGLVGRIALVLHEVKVAAGAADAPPHRHHVELATLEAAITLVEWFGEERARLFSSIASKAPVDHRGALLRWLSTRPDGAATAAEVARSGPRKYRGDSETAELALRALAKTGVGAWHEQPPSARGGRPTARFVLAEQYRGNETPGALGVSEGFGSVSASAGSSAA